MWISLYYCDALMFFFHFLIPSLHISSKDFSFPDPGELPTPVLMVQELGFAYPGCAKLYDGVEFGIDLQSRVALVGPNGARLHSCPSGRVAPQRVLPSHSHLRMSRFTQHFEDVLDLTKTPIQFFKEDIMPKESIDRIRRGWGATDARARCRRR